MGEENSTNTFKMAAVKMPDPLTLGTTATKNWKIFKQRWNTYAVITDFETMPANKQRAFFIHCLADDALEAFNAFQLAEDATVANIITAFDAFIIGEANETYERFVFNRRCQEDREPFELFFADLQRLIKTCNYCENCQTSILKDRIVLGIRDSTVQRDLLKIRRLTLDQCIDICKASENADMQNKELRPEQIHKVTYSKKNSDKFKNKCKFCGKLHEFEKNKCPAYGKMCGKCNRKNHFAAVCKSKYFDGGKHKEKIHKVGHRSEVNDSSSDSEWINNITVTEKKQNQVRCIMQIDNKDVKFQIDTGSSVNILPKKFLDKPVGNTDVVLKTWNNDSYKPIGEARVIIRNPKNKKKYNVKFMISHDNFVPILGLSACEQMKLIEVKDKNMEQINYIDTFSSDVFKNDLGTFEGKQCLKIKDNAKPHIMANRKVPVAMRPLLKEELDRLTELRVIVPVEEPTEWVSQTVIAKKSNGKVRLCIDPQELNKVLIRERYTLPTLDDVLHELSEAKVFSKADLSAGYWHIQLDENSSKLTTFQTCFGRYRWLRLPFGLSVSAEIFQKRLTEALINLPGVICIADDIIVYGSNEEEHDARMKKFLERCTQEGIRLNKDKTKLKVDSITFMGHRITSKGLEVDPNKIKAVKEFPCPGNVSQLRSFLGIVNFLAKFLPNLSDVLYPLHNLLKKETPWNWSTEQDKSFEQVKQLIVDHAVLSFYDPNKELLLECDASDYGLGIVLMQEDKPIAFASRSLSPSERNYAQIEKEMLAIIFGLDKFHHYVYGRTLVVTTDHKPLTSIVNKPLSKAPKRLQSMMLKAQEYDFTLQYKPGTQIPIADALSRGPVGDTTEEINLISNLDSLPLKEHSFLRIRDETENDGTLQKLKQIIAHGWPMDKHELDTDVAVYFNYRDELTMENGIILRGERIVIPKALQRDMKEKVHSGHIDVNASLRRARTYIFWPGMSAEIRQYVGNCNTCSSFQAKQPTQPLYLHPTPERPWQKLGIDIFTIQNRNYLVTVDYYSQFFEVDFLPDMTSPTVISKLKSHIARYGIPDVIISDNGPQMTSLEFKEFCAKYCIDHQTSSPGNSKANGAAEAAVKIAKSLMKKCNHSKQDPYLALLNWRNTPQEGLEYSPVQRLMGRRSKTLLPTNPRLLKPKIIDDSKFRQKKDEMKIKSCQTFAKRSNLVPLQINDAVRMQPIAPHERNWRKATVKTSVNPRSYIVETEDGRQYRRDRQYLRQQKTNEVDEPSQKEPPTKKDAPSTENEVTVECTTSPPDVNLKTRYGRQIKKPSRYVDEY